MIPSRKMYRFAAEKRDFSSAVAILIYGVDADDCRNAVMDPLPPLRKIPEEERDFCVEEPTMQISRDEAVGLMDALWRAGIRPSSAFREPDIPPVLDAQQKHLESLSEAAKHDRAVVMKLLEKAGQVYAVNSGTLDRSILP